MDSKKVIEQLVKIAEKQQRIINKLVEAQALPQPGAGLPPQQLEPVHPELHPGQIIMQHLTPDLKASVKDIKLRGGNTLDVYFQPGRASQPVVDRLIALVNKLSTPPNAQLRQAYTVNPVA